MLCCAFQDPIHVWSGCLEGKLKSFDINSNQEAVIGQHDNAIRCIEYSNDVNAVCSIFIFYHVMQGFFKDNPTSSSKCLGIHRMIEPLLEDKNYQQPFGLLYRYFFQFIKKNTSKL